MHPAFEITKKDIQSLSPEDARTLIGLLCEAELRAANLSTRGVAYGGDDNSADGGLDVVVQTGQLPDTDGYVPRPESGFQVKATKMSPADIKKEMMPNGALRPSIISLAETNGAYIIAGSRDDLSDRMLEARLDTMVEAASSIENNRQHLTVYFYDSNRIASWTKNHPAIVLWVRQKVNRELRGWKPYGNWANSPDGVVDTYLINDDVRLIDTESQDGRQITIKQGIDRLRGKLHQPKACVRLIGLSGVGKTRLVQALFDGRIGDNALNQSAVVYTDTAHSPDPSPRELIKQLSDCIHSAIVVVDNCSAEEHRRTVEAIQESAGQISAITIEYDIQSDLPENTHVFKLEPASTDLIAKLIFNRFDHIDAFAARTIANFSGGNARIAIAIANTARKGENLGQLQDKELFGRLFYQRELNAISQSQLMDSAELLSLVYSFDSEDLLTETSELAVLASFYEIGPKALRRDAGELQSRELVQQRGKWMAVLPHAIANRLASQALTKIPHAELIRVFCKEGNERLLKSFAKRLGYLHDNNQAIRIVEILLSPEGKIGHPDALVEDGNLNGKEVQTLVNLAPVIPVLTLSVIKRAVEKHGANIFSYRHSRTGRQFGALLWHLAYDQQLFEDCVRLLIVLFRSNDNGRLNGSSKNFLITLFQIQYSGTNAAQQQRIEIVRSLLQSAEWAERDLGFTLLNSALSIRLKVQPEYNFGAEHRNVGYWPASQEEINNWYLDFFQFGIEFIQPQAPEHSKIRDALAANFTDIVKVTSCAEKFEDLISRLLEKGYWGEGWVTICSHLHYKKDKMDKQKLSWYSKIKSQLEPKTNIELARTLLFIAEHSYFAEYGTIEAKIVDGQNEPLRFSFERQSRKEAVSSLGSVFALFPEELVEFIPELLARESIHSFYFGRGLAKGAIDKKHVWYMLIENLDACNQTFRSYDALCGYIQYISSKDWALYNEIIEDAFDNATIQTWFPLLQFHGILDESGTERLIKAASNSNVAPFGFHPLNRYNIWSQLTADNIARIVTSLLERKGGFSIALEIVVTVCYFYEEEFHMLPTAIIDLAMSTLTTILSSRDTRLETVNDDDLQMLTKQCVLANNGERNATLLTQQVIDNINVRGFNHYDRWDLLPIISQHHPRLFLELVLTQLNVETACCRWVFPQIDDFGTNALLNVPDREILNWCEQNGEARYPIVAECIPLIQKNSEDDSLILNPMALVILDRCPNKLVILERYQESLLLMGWSGSRAQALERRQPVYRQFLKYPDTQVNEWAKEQIIRLEEQIQASIESERGKRLKNSGSFE